MKMLNYGSKVVRSSHERCSFYYQLPAAELEEPFLVDTLAIVGKMFTFAAGNTSAWDKNNKLFLRKYLFRFGK
jgi:hypothetical protein